VAEALAREHEVVLVSASVADRSHPRFRVAHAHDQELRALATWMDVLVVQGGLLHINPWLVESDRVIVADLYDPSHLENLEQTRGEDPRVADAAVARQTMVINDQLRRGDFFLCASDRQRDFWLGGLAAVGRINPHTYDVDANLRSLIDVVPFGLPAEPPRQQRHGIRGTVPGIGDDDKVVLWAGGVYNWFDPCSLVRAIDAVRREVPQVRLYFLGMRHPNPQIPAMRVATELRRLSDELGLTDRHVFFNEAWVRYEDRADFLLDADIGVSTHLDHIETAYSFRTRILDYLWAGLPMVVTEGDSFADLVRSDHLGAAVAPGDPEAIAAGLLAVLSDPPDRADVRRAADQFTWERALAPLLLFCRSPRRSPDLFAGDVVGWVGPTAIGAESAPVRAPVASRTTAFVLRARNLVDRTIASIRTDGLLTTARRIVAYVRRRAGRVRQAGPG
jgi:glycosyltransferase involved in cell wall biosynthesis